MVLLTWKVTRLPSGPPLGVVSDAVTANRPDCRTCVGTWSTVRSPGASQNAIRVMVVSCAPAAW